MVAKTRAKETQVKLEDLVEVKREEPDTDGKPAAEDTRKRGAVGDDGEREGRETKKRVIEKEHGKEEDKEARESQQEPRTDHETSGAEQSHGDEKKETGRVNDKVAETETTAKEDRSKVEEVEVKELKKSDDTGALHSEPIQINRAPVLHLYASCCAQLQHPDLKWNTCLSLGAAVSSICAISKGRAIGQIAESEADDANRQSQHGQQHISVLQFEIPVKDGVGYVGSTKKTANEGYLKAKFGTRYDEAKGAMLEALQSWKGHEEELGQKGFNLYERFRPGGGGWGAQGGLDLEAVKRIVRRP